MYAKLVGNENSGSKCREATVRKAFIISKALDFHEYIILMAFLPQWTSSVCCSTPIFSIKYESM